MDNYSNLLMDECPPDLQSPNDEKHNSKKQNVTKGVAMSFGFRKRPVTAPTSFTGNPLAARRLAGADNIDRNGNGDTEPLTANAIQSGRTTPRLAPPKKEANATRVSRFGFRQPNTNRLNKISDINALPPTHLEYRNNNFDVQVKSSLPLNVTSPIDSNKNNTSDKPLPNPTKFTLQTSNLPRPELPMRIIETKTAKTLANNSKKVSTMQQRSLDDSSPKDGSLTEDSGVGSNISSANAEVDGDKILEEVNESPTFGAPRRSHKTRNLDVVVSGNMFDVRDLDDTNEPVLPLPRLPSAFQACNTGIVRERTLEYQRNIDRNRRKISITSSEGCSDFGEDEKTYQEKLRNEKNFNKPSPIKTFLKSRQIKIDSSPPSSDDQLWGNAGEAMADDFSCSFSSSDESKDKEPIVQRQVTANTLTDAFETLITASLTNSLPKSEIRNVLLTIEDPKFAAVAAASKSSNLLEDETSPSDSLVCSYSDTEEFKRKLNKSSSNSKDINEKLTLTPSSPGTPTNASNSLSLSDGKDFLIDDEIADQPALVFDETLTACNSESGNVQQNSENNTLVESTPKVKRKSVGAFEQSPLLQRNRKMFLSRGDSVETLSTCESIASDDMMMDFDYSQGSGLDETLDRSERRSGFLSLDETIHRTINELPKSDFSREWTTLIGNYDKGMPKPVNRTSRLLRSRGETPSSIPDSPRSLDGRVSSKTRSSISQSPLRLSRPTLASPGYDSDDSIKLDRTNHSAMVQEVMGMKTMLLKLKRVLHEQADEDILLRSETHNPFDLRKNGLFNGLSSETESLEDSSCSRLELEDLKRQVLFLQGQVEDREKAVQQLQQQMNTLITGNYTSNSAPASTVCTETCNAATQTERIRPISAGPSLLQNSTTDGNLGSLVSANETPRRSRPPSNEKSPISPNLLKPRSKLWRKPGEPPSPQRYSGNTSPSSIPRRSCSRTRAPTIPS